MNLAAQITLSACCQNQAFNTVPLLRLGFPSTVHDLDSVKEETQFYILKSQKIDTDRFEKPCEFYRIMKDRAGLLGSFPSVWPHNLLLCFIMFSKLHVSEPGYHLQPCGEVGSLEGTQSKCASVDLWLGGYDWKSFIVSQISSLVSLVFHVL